MTFSEQLQATRAISRAEKYISLLQLSLFWRTSNGDVDASIAIPSQLWGFLLPAPKLATLERVTCGYYLTNYAEHSWLANANVCLRIKD